MAELSSIRSAVQNLGELGYCVCDGFVAPELVEALRELALDNQRRGLLSAARVGRPKHRHEAIRGDAILWLDGDAHDHATVALLALLDTLQHELNAHLFLSLRESEFHWAIYPPGAGYQKHLDQFSSGDQSRKVSAVLYLNNDWEPEHCGHLRLYLDEPAPAHLDIAPLGGRLVLFDSARFWHEVLPAHRERLSITGWFRTRTGIL